MKTSKDHTIKQLVKQIEEEMKWGKSENWSGEEFDQLSEAILNSTGKSISVTTLKRVFGRVRQESAPSKTTLNILASFIGYENWNQFSETFKQDRNISSGSKWLKIAISMILGLSVIGLIIFQLSKRSNLSEKTKRENVVIKTLNFQIEKSENDLPATVSTNYDIIGDEIHLYSLKTEPNEEAIPLSNSNKRFSKTYYYPGGYSWDLIKNDESVSSNSFFITTKGWRFWTQKSNTNFPAYIEEKHILEDEILSINKDYFQTLNEDPNYLNISMANVDSLIRIDGSHFSFSTELRMLKTFSKSPCQVSTIIVHGSDGDIAFGFSNPGCVGDLNFNFVDEIVSGQSMDLKAFAMSLKEWSNIEVLVKGRNMSILANEKIVLEYSLEKSPGEIGGVSFVFDGKGEIRNTILRDITTEWNLN